MATTESPGSQLAYWRQQLNILDPVLDNAGVIVLIPKLVTDQHTHATLTDANTCTNNSISDQYRTAKTRTLVDQHTSDWAKVQKSVLWMGVFCHSPRALHISDPRLCSLFYGHGLEGCCLLRKCQMNKCLSSEVKC